MCRNLSFIQFSLCALALYDRMGVKTSSLDCQSASINVPSIIGSWRAYSVNQPETAGDLLGGRGASWPQSPLSEPIDRPAAWYHLGPLPLNLYLTSRKYCSPVYYHPPISNTRLFRLVQFNQFHESPSDLSSPTLIFSPLFAVLGVHISILSVQKHPPGWMFLIERQLQPSVLLFHFSPCLINFWESSSRFAVLFCPPDSALPPPPSHLAISFTIHSPFITRLSYD